MQIKNAKKIENTVSLKYLSSFWKSFNILLINSELPLALSWSKTCSITSVGQRLITAADGTNPEQRDNFPKGATL